MPRGWMETTHAALLWWLSALLLMAPTASGDTDPPHPEVDRLHAVPADEGLPQGRIWRTGFDVADLNLDGVPDIVHGPPRKAPGPLAVFLGSEDRQWHMWQGLEHPPKNFTYGDVAAADLDGDGNLDLVVAAHLGELSVLLGNGAGSFVLTETPSPLREFSSRALEVIDWNSDGRLDVAALGEGPSRNGNAHSRGVRVILAAQSGASPTSMTLTSRGAGVFGDALACGDFDGDGDTDLVTASHVLGEKGLMIKNDGEKGRIADLDGLANRSLVWSVAAGDFDEDGRADIAVGYQGLGTSHGEPGVDVLLSAPDGRFSRQELFTHTHLDSAARALTTGDVDGDGHVDLAAVTDNGAIHLFLGLGNGQFEYEHEPGLESAAPGCRGNHIRLVDLDGDGRDDVVATFGDEKCPTTGAMRTWFLRSKG